MHLEDGDDSLCTGTGMTTHLISRVRCEECLCIVRQARRDRLRAEAERREQLRIKRKRQERVERRMRRMRDRSFQTT